tara:strand:+ start:349 stop:1026 length:678 start_codon:yes stop_codon:yes gene_type:complete
MANVTVKALFQLQNGMTVDMESTLTEGTEGELQTSTRYSASAVSIGNYADGMTITRIIVPPSAENLTSYAYIDRRGEIAYILPVGKQGVFAQQYPCNFRLQAGDTVRVLCNTASNRTFAYSVMTNTGVSAIFSGTPSGSGNTDLTHIKSGQEIGQSLTGQSIVAQFATSIDGSKLSTQGVVVLNEQGLPYGGCGATDPADNPIMIQSNINYPVGLNFLARVTTSS